LLLPESVLVLLVVLLVGAASCGVAIRRQFCTADSSGRACRGTSATCRGLMTAASAKAPHSWHCTCVTTSTCHHLLKIAVGCCCCCCCCLLLAPDRSSSVQQLAKRPVTACRSGDSNCCSGHEDDGVLSPRAQPRVPWVLLFCNKSITM
jgi:hypothetical protein